MQNTAGSYFMPSGGNDVPTPEWMNLIRQSTVDPREIQKSYKTKAEFDDVLALSNDRFAANKFFSNERASAATAAAAAANASAAAYAVPEQLKFVPGYAGLPGTTTYEKNRTNTFKTNEITDFPFPEPHLGLKPALRLLKLTLNSDDRVNSADGDASNFIIKVGNLIRNRPITSVSLGDVSFPGGQYLIENTWNHLAFLEGYRCDTDLRSATVRWPDGDYMEIIMPLSTNYITNVEISESEPFTFILTFAEPVATGISDIPLLWSSFKGTVSFSGFKLADDGDFVVNKDDVIRFEAVNGNISQILMTVSEDAYVKKNMENNYLQTQSVLGSVCADGAMTFSWGALLLSPIPSPSNFVQVLNRMVAAGVPVRRDPYTGELIVSNRSVTFSLSFQWDEVIDRGEIRYSAKNDSKGYPTVESPGILRFLGFPPSVKVNPSQIENPTIGNITGLTANPFTGSSENLYVSIIGNHMQHRNPSTGTFVRTGDYSTMIDFSTAVQDAFNGTWFGPEALQPDANVNPYPPFIVSFEESNGVTFTATIKSGRYTPQEVAYQIELQVPWLKVHPIFINDDQEYYGMVFQRRDTSVSFPFMMRFADPLFTDINPLKFGFDKVNYSGHSIYEPPRRAWPAYPNMFQTVSSLRIPVSQHYDARIESFSNQMLISARAYEPRTAKVVSVDTTRQIMVLEFEIAHGRVAGSSVFIAHQPSTNPILKKGLSGIVVPPQALRAEGGNFLGYQYNNSYDPSRGFVGSLNPYQMTVMFGGSSWGSVTFPAEVKVSFTSTPTWSLDLSTRVDNCVQTRVIGGDRRLYVRTRPNLTLKLPNPVRLEGESFVYMLLSLNRQTDEGNTMGYFSNNSKSISTNNGVSVGNDTVNAFARLLVGARGLNKYLDVYDRLFEIKTNSFRNLDTIRIQFRNPDGSFYQFHGNPTSVTLTVNVVEEPMRTTVG